MTPVRFKVERDLGDPDIAVITIDLRRTEHISRASGASAEVLLDTFEADSLLSVWLPPE